MSSVVANLFTSGKSVDLGDFQEGGLTEWVVKGMKMVKKAVVNKLGKSL